MKPNTQSTCPSLVLGIVKAPKLSKFNVDPTPTSQIVLGQPWCSKDFEGFEQ